MNKYEAQAEARRQIIDCLENGKQCDEDGVEIIVSRQAAWEAAQILRALAASPAQAVDGWKMVPVEPTKEMVKAYLGAQHADCVAQDKRIGALYPGGIEQAHIAGYKAEIAAAPAAPADAMALLREARVNVKYALEEYDNKGSLGRTLEIIDALLGERKE